MPWSQPAVYVELAACLQTSTILPCVVLASDARSFSETRRRSQAERIIYVYVKEHLRGNQEKPSCTLYNAKKLGHLNH